MNVLLFLAQRFVRHVREKTVKTMVWVAFLSIMTGACALALVAAVMNGFEHETRRIIQGIHPDLIITSCNENLDYDKLQAQLRMQYGHDIVGIAPNMHQHALVKLPDADTVSDLVVVTGIDPCAEPTVTSLQKRLIEPQGQTFAQLLTADRVLIGEALARNLSVKVGDKIALVHTKKGLGKPASGKAPDDADIENDDDLDLEQHEVTVAGIFKTGIDEIDAHVIYGNMTDVKKMFPHASIDQVGIKLVDASREKALLADIKKTIGCDVISWQALYPALLSALTLEKYAMILILALIILIASANIFALLFMFIAYKKKEIALFKTLGLTMREITSLFVLIGVGLSMVAGGIGVALASIAAYFLKHYPLITLPEVYYVRSLPAEMSVWIVLGVLLLVFFMSLCASLLPARYVGRLEVVAILKETA